MASKANQVRRASRRIRIFLQGWCSRFERRALLLVEIVFVGSPVDRDEVEDALEAAFEGSGEVTGAGAGMGRCHLDLEVEDGVGRGEALRRVDSVLAELGVTKFAQVFVRD
jgi:hypothetical protein